MEEAEVDAVDVEDAEVDEVDVGDTDVDDVDVDDVDVDDVEVDDVDVDVDDVGEGDVALEVGVGVTGVLVVDDADVSGVLVPESDVPAVDDVDDADVSGVLVTWVGVTDVAVAGVLVADVLVGGGGAVTTTVTPARPESPSSSVTTSSRMCDPAANPVILAAHTAPVTAPSTGLPSTSTKHTWVSTVPGSVKLAEISRGEPSSMSAGAEIAPTPGATLVTSTGTDRVTELAPSETVTDRVTVPFSLQVMVAPVTDVPESAQSGVLRPSGFARHVQAAVSGLDSGSEAASATGMGEPSPPVGAVGDRLAVGGRLTGGGGTVTTKESVPAPAPMVSVTRTVTVYSPGPAKKCAVE